MGVETETEVSFTVEGDVAVDSLAEITAFRVVQECLNNVQEHAFAKVVDVSLEGTESTLEVRVEDDGRGFDLDDPSPSGAGRGVGLFSMRERAELLGGSLSLESSPGSGCRATLRIPPNIPSKEVAVGSDSNLAG